MKKFKNINKTKAVIYCEGYEVVIFPDQIIGMDETKIKMLPQGVIEYKEEVLGEIDPHTDQNLSEIEKNIQQLLTE